mmetsp:Transcript_1747/g.2683  ORF Transcript_1747/g.2683 Transcript_1747/m.2683 type:complete len:330 (-) Transcript_1747:131-1120(-)
MFAAVSPKWHNTRVSIQHWQLRDLIIADPNDPVPHFYYVNQNKVLKYDTQARESQTVLQTDYAPTCCAVGLGFVAAGGQQSQLTVKQLDANRICYSGVVGGSVNNALSISRHANDVRILCSNNDGTIKVFSLASMRHVSDICCRAAINYAAVSPDGKFMCAIGDGCTTQLFDARSDSYHQIASWKDSAEAGFSVAWSSASDKLGLGFQDGCVCIWDIRSRQPLAKLLTRTPLPSGIGRANAARQLKFSPSSCIDLLLYSEHSTCVHVVDARTFNSEQVLHVSPSGIEKNISGICFSPDSRRFFVGLEDGVFEYEVNTASRRMFACGSLL